MRLVFLLIIGAVALATVVAAGLVVRRAHSSARPPVRATPPRALGQWLRFHGVLK